MGNTRRARDTGVHTVIVPYANMSRVGRPRTGVARKMGVTDRYDAAREPSRRARRTGEKYTSRKIVRSQRTRPPVTARGSRATPFGNAVRALSRRPGVHGEDVAATAHISSSRRNAASLCTRRARDTARNTNETDNNRCRGFDDTKKKKKNHPDKRQTRGI